MVQDGLMDRFRIEEVYGMHNYPGLPVGQFALRPGPLMAAADRITIEIEGRAGHAGPPPVTIPPRLVRRQNIHQLQSIVASNVGPPNPSGAPNCGFQAGPALYVLSPT